MFVANITFVVADIIFKVAAITSSVAKIAFVVAEITFKITEITSPVANIIFVVAEITLKVAVVTSAVLKITSVVTEITFKVAMITSSVVKITFEKMAGENVKVITNIYQLIPCKINMSENSRWYPLKKRWKLFQWRDKKKQI